jgi:hypothetical protein
MFGINTRRSWLVARRSYFNPYFILIIPEQQVICATFLSESKKIADKW